MGRVVTAMDVLVGAAVVLLLAFTPFAWLVAEHQPGALERTLELPQARPSPDGASIQELPAGLPSGVEASSLEEIRDLAESALGPVGATELSRLLGSGVFDNRLPETAVGGALGHAPYPYRYPAMTRILNAAPSEGRTAQAAALGAALLLLAARWDDEGDQKYPNAGAAAFAVLDRAGSEGSCDPRLNLLLVVAADDQPRDAVVREEYRRATRTCPGDPTPGWVLGQFKSLRAQQVNRFDIPGDAVPEDAYEQALATFEDLVEEFPGSAEVLAGAADVRVREAERIADSQPFTARHEYRIARDLYQRALQVSDSPEIVAGLARSLIGLGEAATAVRYLRGAAEVVTAGYRLELRITAEEAAQDFGSAERTAHRLADRDTSAYAQGPALFAMPTLGSFDGDELEIPLVSVGVDRFLPFQVSLQPPPGGADATVDDVSFIPQFREDFGYVGTMANCPDWAWRRNALLAGHPSSALEGIANKSSPIFIESRPGDQWQQCGVILGFEEARELVALMAEGSADLTRTQENRAYDRWQNMWRWAGDLGRAAAVVEAWLDALPKESLPMLRLGEVRYLQGEYDESAEAFGSAARRTRQAQWDNDLGVDEALLGRSAALVRAGRHDEAMELLRFIDRDASLGVAYHRENSYGEVLRGFAAVAYHARALLADVERESGALTAALEDYAAAAEMSAVLADGQATGHRPERLYGNRAVAELAADRTHDAMASIRRALRADPMNPVFLMTAGFIADSYGDRAAAIDFNRLTLDSDAGAFPAANDLGVQLARDGRDAEAVVALRNAIYANPSYALGWFNLGVVYAGMGLQHMLASQGAFARAIQLDSDFADREPELTIDAKTYRTSLDLSKPLPPRWSFADLERYGPAAPVGLLAILLLGVGMARSTSKGGSDVAGRWANTVIDTLDRVPGVNRLREPSWAIVLTVVLFLFTMARQGGTDPSALVVAGLGVVILACAAVRARVVAARMVGMEVRQSSWPPGMVLGVAATAVVAPWAPLPVVESDEQHAEGNLGDQPDSGEDMPGRIHAAAPVVLGVVTLVLFLQIVWFPVPLSRFLATTGLIMTASVLLPVVPLDGARLTKTGLLAGAGIVGAITLFLLGFF